MLSTILADLITHDVPRALRLDGGLALAYTPPDPNGQARLLLSRHAEGDPIFPSQAEVDTVCQTLGRALTRSQLATLTVGSPTAIVTPNHVSHGCIPITWYAVVQEPLIR